MYLIYACKGTYGWISLMLAEVHKSKQVIARRGTMRNVYVLEKCRTTLASVIKTVHYDNAFVITRHRCQPIAFKILIDYMPVKRLNFF